MDTVLPALVVLTYWTFPSFLQKKTLRELSPLDLTLNKWIIGGTISLFILLLLGNKYDINKNKKTYGNTLTVVLLAMAAHLMYYHLLTKTDASTLMIVLNPINIIMAALVGCFMFGEKFNRDMWIGVFIIVCGLILFLKGKGQLK